MNILFQKIVEPNNLYWAWEKARNIYKPGDIWYNELELAGFEANLTEELQSIADDIVNGLYRLQPIQPVAYPKSKGGDGLPRTRQTFWIAVRDQVAWLAIVNIVGRYIDAKMPAWSYGNRLHISMFYDEDRSTGYGELKFGYYRNTSGKLFRKWSQSWPLYRRHINITAKFLTKEEQEFKVDLDEQEKKILEINKTMLDHPLKSAYLDKNYWKARKREGLFWAALDLEKFYPQINIEVIKSNLHNHLPIAYRSQEFENLIDAMFSFRTDLTGWSTSELEIIKVDPIQGSYNHLPTGLLVAGFLANVAMLEVDMEIQSRLLINRNVAHFRYVDDHVILSTNFDQLLAWIDQYKTILADSNIGTTFNLEKTEPAAVAEYFNVLETGDVNELIDHKEKAKKECSLDPDFPNPLMTQTLGKVSRIAGTSFNLLTPDEEQTLVADIEHLLLTDFPDHELRKDTRVSFAARMLSVLVPQLNVDSSIAYRLHRNLCLKRTAIDDIKGEIRKAELTADLKEQLKKQLTELVSEEKTYQKELEEEEERLKRNEENLANRTIKLLLKAVQDNHDKVRLWSRLLEFFFKSGSGKPKVIFNETRKLLERKESNSLSLTFIHALILQVLSQLLFEAVRVLESLEFSKQRKARSIRFVENLLDEDLFSYFDNALGNSTKKYEIVSWQMFRFSAGTVIRIINEHFKNNQTPLNEELIAKFGLVDFNNMPERFMDTSHYSRGTWAWWLFKKLPQPRFHKSPYLWERVNSRLNYDLAIDLNVLLLYPAHVSPLMLSRLDLTSNENLLKNESLLYEIYKHISQNEASNYFFLDKVARKNKQLSKSITVDEWITWLSQKQKQIVIRQNEPLVFDPRLGEWSALEIIRQIAEEVKCRKSEFVIPPEQKKIEYFRYIHPHNFKISIEWTADGPLTWEDITRLFSIEHNRVTLRAIDDCILDNRFIPQFGINSENENQSIIRALGTILIALLSKNTDVPPKWNPVGFQQAWLYLAQYKLRDLAISTYTRDIIKACFSDRNVETQFNLGMEQPNFYYEKDYLNDPPMFRIVDDFIKYVKFALDKLKTQQLSVAEHQPRQLTPISLVHLKRNDYQYLLGEDQKEELL